MKKFLEFKKEDIFDTSAVSAVKVLQIANKSNIPVYSINKENNIDSIL